MIYNLTGKFHYYASITKKGEHKNRANESCTGFGNSSRDSDNMSYIPRSRLADMWVVKQDTIAPIR